MNMSRVLILDQSYMPLNTVKRKKALKMWCKSLHDTEYVVDIISSYEDDKSFKVLGEDMKPPAIVRIGHKVNISKSFKLFKSFNRKNVWLRDDEMCQYCGTKITLSQMTFDHVHPRDKSGKTNWTNIVTCCKKCNSKKGNKTLKESNMKLLKKPEAPYSTSSITQSVIDRLKSHIKDVPHESWKQFLWWEK